MFRMFSQKVRKQDGFTLIELIVVVAILGILAAVLTPRVLDAIDNAEANGAEAFGKEIQLAMERYYLDNNGYPSVDQMEAQNGDTALDYADLVMLLGKYASIDESQFDADHATEFDYKGYEANGTTAVTDATKPKVYEIVVRLKDSARTVTIRPNRMTVAE